MINTNVRWKVTREELSIAISIFIFTLIDKCAKNVRKIYNSKISLFLFYFRKRSRYFQSCILKNHIHTVYGFSNSVLLNIILLFCYKFWSLLTSMKSWWNKHIFWESFIFLWYILYLFLGKTFRKRNLFNHL